MKAKLLFLFVFVSTACGQTSVRPTIKFSFSNPKLTPSAFSLEVNDECLATYYSNSADDQTLVEQPGKDDDERETSSPVPPPPSPAPAEPMVPRKVRSFPMTQMLCHQIFDLAQAASNFGGDFQFRKHKVAFTGDRTLEYISAEAAHKAKYTWSENPSIQKLTAIFEGISTTLEAAPRLQRSYRFDRLGLNEVLSHLVEVADRGWLQEVWLIEPDLKRISADPKVMNIARQRANYLIEQSHKGQAVGTKK